MIIFSQGPTAHSRLANSLEWMSKIQDTLDISKHTACFPWGIENFGNYFDRKSFWMNKNNADELYFARTKRELSAADLSSLARIIERNHEIKNNLQAYSWDKLVTYSNEFQCLYVSGAVDITNDENINLLSEHDFIIIHEPFKLQYKTKLSSKTDYSKIIPKPELVSEQSAIVNSLNQGKRKIGLHIRRGDYALWESGRYYFDDEFWLAKAKELIESDYAVYIFTNELNPDFHAKIRELGAIVSNESFEVDFVRMMLMNEIYGPPSTFSVLALKIAKACFGYDSKFHYLPA